MVLLKTLSDLVVTFTDRICYMGFRKKMFKLVKYSRRKYIKRLQLEEWGVMGSLESRHFFL